jgi:hypothetical protein
VSRVGAAIRLAGRRGPRAPLNAPAKSPVALRLQCLRIERERAMAFLQSKQSAGVPDDIGVGDAAVLPEHGRIAGGGIAPTAEQRLCAACSASHFGVRTQRLR